MERVYIVVVDQVEEDADDSGIMDIIQSALDQKFPFNDISVEVA